MVFNYGLTTVTLSRGAFFGSNVPYIEHSQSKSVAEDETPYVYDHSSDEWLYTFRVKVSNAERSALRAFVKNTIVFAKYAFNFTPDSPVDLGAGAGTQITTARWWEDSYNEVPESPGFWMITFTLRSYSTGTNNPS